ncbi:MAG TPA: WD40 repeat domain-containing protein [Streptomyces sp.]|nr:WD40 repeat domain-containing protein [Streptomyces sp.]
MRPERVFHLSFGGEPHAVVALPNGETCVVSAENGGDLYRVSLRGGEVANLRGGHGMPVNGLALADRGRLLLSASDDGTVRVWDTARWRVTAVLEGHEGYVRAVAGAGGTAVSAGEDRTVRVWDLRTGRQRALFEDHGESVDEVAVSADGRRAASSTRDNGLRLWDLSAPGGPRLERELYGATSEVHYVGGFLGSSAYLSFGDNDSGVGHHNAPGALLFGPDGDLFSSDEEIVRWDAAAGTQRWRSAPQGVGAHALALHPRLPLLVSATVFGMQVLVLAGKGRPDRGTALGTGIDGSPSALTFTGDGRLVSVHDDHTVCVWPEFGDVRELDAGPRHTAPVAELSVGPSGRWAATHCDNREVMLWDLAGGGRSAVLDDHSRRVTTRTALTKAPVFLSGRTVALHDTGRVHLWEAGEGRARPARTLEPESGGEPGGAAGITQVLAVDEETLLVEPYGGPWELWPVDGGRRRRLQDRAGVRLMAAARTADGRGLLTTSSLERDHPLLAGDPGAREATEVLGRPSSAGTWRRGGWPGRGTPPAGTPGRPAAGWLSGPTAPC